MSRLRSNPWAVLMVLCMGFFMIMLDSTIVNIAIPSIVDSLHASMDQVLWILNGYILAYAVLLITAGRLGDMYGQRNLFALGMAIFVLASAYSGLAPDSSHLIAARVIQGLGGALLTPQTLAILTNIFPPDRRGAAFGIWGAVGGVAGIAGPTLGGLIVTSWSWRWVFYLNLPIGIAAIVATFLLVPDLRTGRRHGLDFVGVLLASVGLLAVVFGLIEGQRFDWGTIWAEVTIPEVITFGILVLILFVVWEGFQREPLVPLSLFKDRNYSLMNWVGGVLSFGMFGMMLPFTIYFQAVLGMSALNAGLAMVPMSAVGLFVAPLAGRYSDKIGGKYILMAGLAFFAGGMALGIKIATPDSTWVNFLGVMILMGLGQGCVFSPMATVALRHITPVMAGSASGVLNTTRQLGGVIGSAVVGAVFQNQLASAFHAEAVSRSALLPARFREGFVSAFNDMVKGGLEVGRSQAAGPQLPAGVPAQVAEQIQRVAHDVFGYGFVAAMGPTISLSIIVLLVGAGFCLLVESQKKAAARAAAREEWASEA